MNKEFSDALGFKLLSSFTGFIAEYPVEGAMIQKICDDSFTANCFKCYPIIANAGVDPVTYVPKNNAQAALRNELRKQFPIREVEDVTEIKKPESPVSQTASSPSLSSNKTVLPTTAQPTPLQPKTNPFKPTPVNYVAKCQKCLMIKQAEDLNIKTIQDLQRQLVNEQTRNKTLHRDLNNAHAEIKTLRNELIQYKSDPEFQTILQYQKMKRQRK